MTCSPKLDHDYASFRGAGHRSHGQAAVVNVRAQQNLSFMGQDASGPFRITEVFIKHGEAWRAVMMQVTRIAPAP